MGISPDALHAVGQEEAAAILEARAKAKQGKPAGRVWEAAVVDERDGHVWSHDATGQPLNYTSAGVWPPSTTTRASPSSGTYRAFRLMPLEV